MFVRLWLLLLVYLRGEETPPPIEVAFGSIGTKDSRYLCGTLCVTAMVTTAVAVFPALSFP